MRFLLGALILLAALTAAVKGWGMLVLAYDDQSFFSLVSGISFLCFSALGAVIAWLAAFGSLDSIGHSSRR